MADEATLALEAARVSELTGQMLSRPHDHVPVLYLTEGLGGVAFGGILIHQ
ncbi:MAG: hypothetical protein WD002_14785 [Pseudomonadales bacterium]